MFLSGYGYMTFRSLILIYFHYLFNFDPSILISYSYVNIYGINLGPDSCGNQIDSDDALPVPTFTKSLEPARILWSLGYECYI